MRIYRRLKKLITAFLIMVGLKYLFALFGVIISNDLLFAFFCGCLEMYGIILILVYILWQTAR